MQSQRLLISAAVLAMIGALTCYSAVDATADSVLPVAQADDFYHPPETLNPAEPGQVRR
ncbi:hypothetical protein [Nocardia suismassiliense]|uniref:hypothetical protein n=1 Tax=Nocardia suismassiliense TaxID=2077092 RepID=UPI00131F3D9D|nr:hypothetical protein [Nocardia suismassiliense]